MLAVFVLLDNRQLSKVRALSKSERLEQTSSGLDSEEDKSFNKNDGHPRRADMSQISDRMTMKKLDDRLAELTLILNKTGNENSKNEIAVTEDLPQLNKLVKIEPILQQLTVSPLE